MTNYRTWTIKEFIETVEEAETWDTLDPEVYEYFLDCVDLNYGDYDDPDEMWEDFLQAAENINKEKTKMKKLYELNEGTETALVQGTENEILDYLKDNIEDLTAGFYESAEGQEKQDLESFYKDVEEAESLEDIDLDRVNYSYWALEVK